MSDFKGAKKIKGGRASQNEAEVTATGAIRVTLDAVPAIESPGTGESRIKGGVAAHNEAVVVNGMLRVRIV